MKTKYHHLFPRRGVLLFKKHLEQQTLERKRLAKHRKKCLSHPLNYIGIVIDGMDQKNICLPHWYKTSKSIEEGCIF
jgi:hypothetical protein